MISSLELNAILSCYEVFVMIVLLDICGF